MNEHGAKKKVSTALQLVTFRLGTERYGVPVWMVREIIRPIEASPIPGLIGPMEGVINLRGGIVPVFRIHSVLGVRECDDARDDRKRRIVILDRESGGMGFMVDEVMEVVRVMSQDIQPPPDVGCNAVTPEAILGIVQVSDQMVICIDPQKLVGTYVDLKEASTQTV